MPPADSGGGGGGGGGGGKQGRRKRPTEQEARAAVRRILVHLFDLPAVLRGKKPLAELTGSLWVCGSLGVIFVRVAITAISQNQRAKMAGSMYLRDSRQFAIDLAQRVLLSAFSCANSSAGWWFRRRVEIAWQKKITDGLHDSYFHDNFFYTQTLKLNAVADPGQRIVRDVMMLTGQLTRFCQSSLSCTLEASWAVVHLIWRMPDRWYFAPLIIVVQWLTIKWRNWFASALKRGMRSAKASQARGAYLDAHSKLARGAEAIISLGGVKAEAQRIAGKLHETLQLSKKMNIDMFRDTVAMGVSKDIIGMTMTYALAHIPLLSASHPLKVTSQATEELRMQANANLLSEMTFTMSLVKDVRSEVGQLMRSGRTLMQLSGYAMRIAELLDETESGKVEAGASPPDAVEDADCLAISDVDVKTPTGTLLIQSLSFSVTKGRSLAVVGANGVGKTSIMRTLSGLWPPPGGQVTCAQSTVFLPQTPYFPLGSLQDAVTYPRRLQSSMNTNELQSLMKDVNLEHLMKDSAAQAIDWNAQLSLGEKQQLALARILLTKPTFAVLDEATSAIEEDTELDLFEKLQKKSITLITVTHSPSLLQYHEQILRIKGADVEGGGRSWSINDIGADDEPEVMTPSQGLRRTVSADERAFVAEKKAAEVSKLLAARSEEFATKSGKPMPEMSDLRRTLLLFRTVVQWENLLMDKALMQMAGYLCLMAAGTWVTTGYLSGIPGALQALVIQSDARAYMYFQVRIMGMRLVSMALSSSQQWLRSGVSIVWRERMTRALTERYMSHNNFYTMKHIDKRIGDADSRIAQEIDRVVMKMNYLVMRVTRPVLDAAYCTILLMRIQLPFAGLVAMWVYGFLGLGMIGLLAPDFALLATEDERVMANFRSVHDRTRDHSESIAFQKGGPIEKEVADEASGAVLELLHRKNNQRALWNGVDMFLRRRTPDFITQMLRMYWSFGQGTDGEVLAVEGGTRMAATSQFIGSLIERSFDTFSSLLGVHEELQELFGTCRRVSDVWLVLDELDRDRKEDVARVEATEQPATPRRGERICMTGASIVAPDGQCLARDLSFSVTSADDRAGNLLITGPNGCGKSSVARILSKVWAVGAGGVGRPHNLSMIPQGTLVPTLPLSLLDLLLYPKQLKVGGEEERAAIATLSPLMEGLRVRYLVDRNEEEGFHAVRQWDKLLSMGEQQCLALIRLLYRQPKFAVLDEPTSALSKEVTTTAFAMLQARGIKYVSFSQSEALAGYHSQQLRLGEANPNGWSLEPVGTPRVAKASGPSEFDLSGTDSGSEGDGGTLGDGFKLS